MRQNPASTIRLLVSDVDGTLVTDDKRVTSAVSAAAARLAESGVLLALISARPPEGLASVMMGLGLKAPSAGFNGGKVLDADGSVLHSATVPEELARLAAGAIRKRGFDLWVFADGKWLIDRSGAAYEDLERRTLGFGPTFVPDVEAYLDRAGKLVGTTDDAEGLAECEVEVEAVLEGQATAHRSQRYYLDVTHRDANKGVGIRKLAELFDIPLAETASIGDMTNDIGMLEAAGLAISMGNAPDIVRSASHVTTGTNEQDGWATAVDRYVMPRARRRG